MHTLLTDRELLETLAPAVEENLRRHIDAADGWQPHDYVPWDDGRNFGFLYGRTRSAVNMLLKAEF